VSFTVGQVLAHKGAGHGAPPPLRWRGSPPVCDFCQEDLKDKPFVDGKTTRGPWAIMCIMDHHDQGRGIGTGRGQLYNRQHIKVGG
jgi:hypothetical protein